MADGAKRDDLALELVRRVAVHVSRVAHLGGVPQAAGLVDALEPRHTVEELRDEDDHELGPALALRPAAEVFVDARPSEQRPLEGPATAHPLDVAVELAPVDGFGGNDHGADSRARARPREGGLPHVDADVGRGWRYSKSPASCGPTP